LFLANIAWYSAPVLDPWFDAQVSLGSDFTQVPLTLYGSQDTVSVMGCRNVTQVWNPLASSGTQCVSVHSYSEDYNNDGTASAIAPVSADLGLTMEQGAMLSRLSPPFANAIDMASSTVTYDGNLLASRATDSIFSTALPPNQWILELQHWFSILLTTIQVSVTDSLTGVDPRLNHYLQPMAAEYSWMCTNQIVQSAQYASFSVLGLAIILVVRGFLVVTNSILSTVWTHVVPHTQRKKERDAEWKAYELLELQRLSPDNDVDSNSHKEKWALLDAILRWKNKMKRKHGKAADKGTS
jgi:hypothetical protein